MSNRVGQESDAFDVIARMKDAALDVTGELKMEAINTSTVFGNANAVSAAVAVSGTVGLAASGAGADVHNRIYTNTAVEIERTAATTDRSKFIEAGSVTLLSTESASARAIAVGAAVAVAVGGKGVGLAISIGVALSTNDIAARSGITITDNAFSAAPMVKAGRTGVVGSITGTSTNTTSAEARAVAASIAASFGLGAGISISGAGANSTNRIGNTSEIVVTRASLETVGISAAAGAGDIDFQATSVTTSTAAVVSVAAAASGGIIAGAGSIGVSLGNSKIGGERLSDRAHVTRAYHGSVLVCGIFLSSFSDRQHFNKSNIHCTTLERVFILPRHIEDKVTYHIISKTMYSKIRFIFL